MKALSRGLCARSARDFGSLGKQYLAREASCCWRLRAFAVQASAAQACAYIWDLWRAQARRAWLHQALSQTPPDVDPGKDWQPEDGKNAYPDENIDHHLENSDHDTDRRAKNVARTPLLRWRRRRRQRRCGRRQIDRDHRIGRLPGQIIDLSLNLLDLPFDIRQLILKRQGIRQVLRLTHQLQQALLLHLQILQTRLQVHILRCDILHRLIFADQLSLIRGIGRRERAQIVFDGGIFGRADRKRDRNLIGAIALLIDLFACPLRQRVQREDVTGYQVFHIERVIDNQGHRKRANQVGAYWCYVRQGRRPGAAAAGSRGRCRLTASCLIVARLGCCRIISSVGTSSATAGSQNKREQQQREEEPGPAAHTARQLKMRKKRPGHLRALLSGV